MTERSFGYQNGQTLRYVRRSSVYSRRTFDKADVMPTAKQAEPVEENNPKPTTYFKQPEQRSSKAMQDFMFVQPKQPVAVKPPRSNGQPQATLRVPEAEPRLTWRHKLLTKNNVLMTMAVFVFLMGLGVSIQTLLANKDVSQQVQAISTSNATVNEGTSGDDKPDETPLPSNAITSYKVAPELPRKITIPKIKVSARVKALGVSRENQLLAPTSIYDTGWYNSSAKPGVDAGAVLINGHVHGPTRPGIFANLKKLTSGDIIEIERGDGEVVKYKIEKTQSLPTGEIDMTALLSSVKPGKQGLNLITCGGKYDVKSGHYESRDMVFAVQAD